MKSKLRKRRRKNAERRKRPVKVYSAKTPGKPAYRRAKVKTETQRITEEEA